MPSSTLILLAGVALVAFGAHLIGPWAVGVVLVLLGAGLVAHALLRNVPERPTPRGHGAEMLEDVLDTYRQMP